jgi:nicotinamidase-related amidase
MATDRNDLGSITGGTSMREPALSSALVVVDMQFVFADPASPWAVPGFDRLIEPISRLVTAFGERVAFTRFLIPEEPSGSWARYYERWPFAADPGVASLLELVEPWTHTGHQRVERARFSKWGWELEDLAGESKALTLCGVTTDCCVLATALGAIDAGMTVLVVEDACAGTDRDSQRRATELLRGFDPQIVLTSTESALSGLHSSVP